MNAPDELGILADYRREAISEKLEHILWEIFANRKHNPDKTTAKFLFMRYETTEGRYFILATNHYRTEESIEKEYTPFKFNESVKDTEAAIASRGYGAKLFPFHVRGKSSNIFAIKDSDTFSSDLNSWAMKDWINMDELGRVIDFNQKFNPVRFRTNFITPISERPGEIPFFLKDYFAGKPVDVFMRSHNFKYFYVFLNYNDTLNTSLTPALQQMARIYEGADLEIYESVNFMEPIKVTHKNSFGLLPSYWTTALTFDWKLGELDDSTKKYYKSTCRLSILNSDSIIWFRNDSNGSADSKFNHRTASYTAEEGWKADVRVTIPLTSISYKDTLDKDISKLYEQIYMRMQDDIISIKDADAKISSKLRNTLEPSRLRVIVDILNEDMKTNPNSGMITNSIKARSTVTPLKGIHEMIFQSLGVMGKYLKLVKEKEPTLTDSEKFITTEMTTGLTASVEMDKKNSTRSTKRKKEALKFEAAVAEKVSSEMKEVKWNHSDATISATNDLEGEGIDTLGELKLEDRTIWISIQSKDRESAIPKAELEAFTKTVHQLKEKKLEINPNDKFISVLCLAKEKSFNYKLYQELLHEQIFTIVEDKEDVGSITLATIQTLYDMLL